MERYWELGQIVKNWILVFFFGTCNTELGDISLRVSLI